MNRSNITDSPAFSGFMARLCSKGSTAIGAEAVARAILGNRSHLETALNGNLSDASHQGKSVMNTTIRKFRTTALAALVATGAALTGLAYANAPGSSVKLLTAKFEPRHVVQVEVGDFHFLPGQVAPIHTHDAPAVGYVAKGAIIYQVEGEKPQILREGDAFYEPAGPRILRFDNASATEEAIFLDFNLEREGDPFIVFESPPAEAIDRRGLPTVDLEDQTVDQVDIYASDLSAGGALTLDNDQPTLGLVSEGVVELLIDGVVTQRIAAGASFALPTDGTQATLVNASSEVPAKVVTFLLR